MFNPDADLQYLLQSGFSRPQAEAILAVKRMAALRYPEQTIRMTLLKRGFSVDQAEVITRAALKANVAPPSPLQPRKSRTTQAGATGAFIPARTSRIRRIVAIIIWILVINFIRLLLFEQH